MKEFYNVHNAYLCLNNGSRPTVGSRNETIIFIILISIISMRLKLLPSRTSRLGLWIIQAAKDTRRFWPPLQINLNFAALKFPAQIMAKIFFSPQILNLSRSIRQIKKVGEEIDFIFYRDLWHAINQTKMVQHFPNREHAEERNILKK